MVIGLDFSRRLKQIKDEWSDNSRQVEHIREMNLRAERYQVYIEECVKECPERPWTLFEGKVLTAWQCLQGEMASDGDFGYSLFRAVRSSNREYKYVGKIPMGELLKYLEHFVDVVLIPLGFPLSMEGYPHVTIIGYRPGGREPYYGVRLWTGVTTLGHHIQQLWYPNGVKEIPNDPHDFDLTPITLAYIHMGDGNAVHKTGVVSLSLEAFNLHSIENLERQLYNKYGIRTGRSYLRTKVGAGIIMTVNDQANIKRFNDVIGPYVIDPYRYKIRDPYARESLAQKEAHMTLTEREEARSKRTAYTQRWRARKRDYEAHEDVRLRLSSISDLRRKLFNLKE